MDFFNLLLEFFFLFKFPNTTNQVKSEGFLRCPVKAVEFRCGLLKFAPIDLVPVGLACFPASFHGCEW